MHHLPPANLVDQLDSRDRCEDKDNQAALISGGIVFRKEQNEIVRRGDNDNIGDETRRVQSCINLASSTNRGSNS